MTNINKIKLGLDISRIHHIISRKMDAAVIKAIDDNLTVSQAYVIDFISMEGNKKEIFQKDLEKHFGNETDAFKQIGSLITNLYLQDNFCSDTVTGILANDLNI